MGKSSLNNREKNKKLVVFTTTYKSKMGGIKDLLVGLGKKEAIEIDKEYQTRKIFGPWGLDELAKLYQGFTEEKLKGLSFDYHLEYLLPGISEFVFALKERGFLIGVLNSNPQFMMDNLKERLPLDFAIGTKLEFKDEMATGRIQEEVNRYTEVEILQQKRKEYDIDKKNVITLGRSSLTHLPIAKESAIYIGFDPTKKETIRDIARVIVTNKNLQDVFFGK